MKPTTVVANTTSYVFCSMARTLLYTAVHSATAASTLLSLVFSCFILFACRTASFTKRRASRLSVSLICIIANSWPR